MALFLKYYEKAEDSLCVGLFSLPHSSGGSMGGARGPAPSPLFLDQNGAQGAEKIWGGDCSAPYFRVWMTGSPPPPLSQDLDPSLLSPPFISFPFVHIYVYVIIN